MAGPSRKHEDRHEEFVFRVRRPQPPTASAFSLANASSSRAQSIEREAIFLWRPKLLAS